MKREIRRRIRLTCSFCRHFFAEQEANRAESAERLYSAWARMIVDRWEKVIGCPDCGVPFILTPDPDDPAGTVAMELNFLRYNAWESRMPECLHERKWLLDFVEAEAAGRSLPPRSAFPMRVETVTATPVSWSVFGLASFLGVPFRGSILEKAFRWEVPPRASPDWRRCTWYDGGLATFRIAPTAGLELHLTPQDEVDSITIAFAGSEADRGRVTLWEGLDRSSDWKKVRSVMGKPSDVRLQSPREIRPLADSFESSDLRILFQYDPRQGVIDHVTLEKTGDTRPV